MIEQGVDITPLLINSQEPVIPNSLMVYWRAFNELSDSRRYDFGSPLPISIIEVSAYAGIVGMTSEEDLADLWYFVHGLDEVFYKIQNRKSKKK